MTVVTDYFQSNIGDDQDQGEEQDPVGPSPDPLHRARSQETGDWPVVLPFQRVELGSREGAPSNTINSVYAKVTEQHCIEMHIF